MTADTFDPEIRSWIMSRVQSRDTKPEQIVCGALRDAHIRFSTNGEGPTRKSGYYSSQNSFSRICEWLFLALAWLQAQQNASVQRCLLGEENRTERRTRQAK